ncbi:MAG: DUF1015 domain-containing protein [Blastocatellia bacterium]|nr:DUF1015 domain-containing protein [Blastocatellia bacterium]
MAIVKPFHAQRPHSAQAAAVSAVPYDVVNTAEARALAADNPLSFLHVSRPEIDLPDGTDMYADEVYAKAKSNFDQLIAQAPLIIETHPSFYLYRLRMGDREQTGLVACCSVDEYDNNIICKHERTRRDKEDDRTRHILTIRAQTGPVFLTYRADKCVNTLLEPATLSEPLFDFIAVDGIAHTIWRIPNELNAPLAEAFTAVPVLYIADGHHRAKSASRAREALQSQNPNHTGEEEYNFFQCVIFPDDQLRILPYNRAVKDLNSHTPEAFLEALQFSFQITENAAPLPTERGHFAMYLGGKWYGLKLKPEATQPLSIIDRLDVSILQDRLLSPILGIADPRTDKRIDFIGGIRGTDELERLVNNGQAAVAFSMFATTLEELMAVSDADEIMPPKSTWFEPKLRDGLLSHLI